MNIQSLSIVVPTFRCWNHCKYCVSYMHHEEYNNIFENSSKFYYDIPISYLRKMAFIRDEGCNTLILTGTAEPQQNLSFIYSLLNANFQRLPKPFYNIAIQTTGTNLTTEEIKELSKYGVTTLAISLSSFDDTRNWDIINAPNSVRTLETQEMIWAAKECGMTVRLCINLTDEFNDKMPKQILDKCKELEADQVTFRKIYTDGENKEAIWVKNHEFPEEKFNEIKEYIKENGNPIVMLPYGHIQYGVDDMSVVIDDNCMSKNNILDMKYAILRPDGHLYSRWDDKGSLIF